MDVFTAISGRRSCRKFCPEAVSDTDIEKILEAGNWAPSPANQTEGFVVVFVIEPETAFSVTTPEVSTLQPEKTATPETGITGLTSQVSVPGPEASASVTAVAWPVTVLPKASWTVTVGCCVHGVPAEPVGLGTAVNTSEVAAPAEIATAG